MNKFSEGTVYLFKMGVITDEIPQYFEVTLDVAIKYRLDRVEIRSLWDKSAHDLDNSDIARIKDLPGKTGGIFNVIKK